MSYTNKTNLIKDRGGTRSGIDRRQNLSLGHKIERRKYKDRRRGFDRRSGLGSRRDQNLEKAIERRDSFRHEINQRTDNSATLTFSGIKSL